MSIYVYITRHHNPLDDGPSIDEAEWLGAIAADSSFREPKAAEMETPPRRNTVYRAWSGHPDGLDTLFAWTDGQIDIANPDEAMIVKALQVADKLGAHVVSETGEIYNEDGSHKGFVDGEPW